MTARLRLRYYTGGDRLLIDGQTVGFDGGQEDLRACVDSLGPRGEGRRAIGGEAKTVGWLTAKKSQTSDSGDSWLWRAAWRCL
jgi:hypothetical protein